MYNNYNDKSWIEKYRPTKRSDIMGHKYILNTFENIIKNDYNIPHLLFYGPAGTGKTSTILTLCKELFGPNNYKNRVLELNASDDRGIDVVRKDIINFVKMDLSLPDTKYPSPPYKVLILDEADAMTIDAQTSLRIIMEENGDKTKFCIICNYINKIIQPIISRCMEFKFLQISEKEVIKKLKYISEKENLILEDNIYELISNLSNGDLRKAIGILQNINYYKLISPINEKVVCDLTGIISNEDIELFINDIKNIEDYNKIVDNIYYKGFSIKKLCEELIIKFKNNKNIVFSLMKLINDINRGCNDIIIIYNIIKIIKNNL